MKEFGSDFHAVNIPQTDGNTVFDYYPNALFVADGRQAIELSITTNGNEFGYQNISAGKL